MDPWQILAKITSPLWVIEPEAEQLLWSNQAAQTLAQHDDLNDMRLGQFSALSCMRLGDY